MLQSELMIKELEVRNVYFGAYNRTYGQRICVS
jgi:hypothetical protein